MTEKKIKEFKITRFDPSIMKPGRVTLVIGNRGTGMSILQEDLLFHYRNKLDATIKTLGTKNPAKKVKKVLDFQKLNAVGSNEKLLKIGIVSDNLFYDKNVIFERSIRELFLNGCCYNITSILGMKYLLDMGADSRNNVDYIFVFRDNKKSNQKKIYDYFFGVFDHFDDFRKVFQKCTENHECLVLDNTLLGSRPEECIFWYKANANLPKFTIGEEKQNV